MLARTDMVARPLPSSALPSDPNFVSGTWNGRLGDAGDGTFVFPNATSGDGVPWRDRFDSSGHCEFLQVLDNGVVDFVGVIDQVQVDQQKVTVHASDGWFLLKKAYERDWVVTQAPRDVIERGTQVWVPTTVDDFPVPGSSISSGVLTTPTARWNVAQTSGASVSVGPSGGLDLAVPTTALAQAGVDIFPGVTVPTCSAWRASCSLSSAALGGTAFLGMEVVESSSDQYQVAYYGGEAYLYFYPGGTGPKAMGSAMLRPSATYNLMLESDGEWVWGFVNGQVIGCARRASVSTTSLALSVGIVQTPTTGAAASATVTGAFLEALQPFLIAGDDVGDRVLPGDALTRPGCGLRARYRR